MLNEREIKVTTDYGMFKRMKGNRGLSKQRETAILKSISENGYVGAPILVNEKMEVVDGQGRLNACRELGVPIPYCVRRGADIYTCMLLNRNTRNWTDVDYIKSFVEQGIEDYNRLLTLMTEFDTDAATAYFAAKMLRTGGSSSPIRRGTLQLSEKEYLNAHHLLTHLSRVTPYLRKAKLPMQRLSWAVLYSLNYPLVNNDRLEKVLKERYMDIVPSLRMDDLLEQISEMYNRGLKGAAGRVWLKEAYQKEQYAN